VTISVSGELVSLLGSAEAFHVPEGRSGPTVSGAVQSLTALNILRLYGTQ
jgi:hypothetical protein